MPAWRRSSRYRPIDLTPTCVGTLAADLAPGSWHRLIGLAGHAWSPASIRCASPGSRASGSTSAVSCPAPRRKSPATARAGPKQSAAAGTTSEPRGIGPTDADGCPHLLAGGATFIAVADRSGRAPLVRFVPLQHSPATARCPADASHPDDPASAFSPPARALSRSADRRRPPVRFYARDGRGSVSLVWRAGSGFLSP